MPPKDDESSPHLPRGASPSELDVLRAAVRVQQRAAPAAANGTAAVQHPDLKTPASVAMLVHRPELDAQIEEGRKLLERDAKLAHAHFERIYRKNVNDARVLSNYGLTLVLVEGDRQRGILFCEEAVRRGPATTEALVNLARALIVTRNKEQAVRALRRAQELAPDDPRVSAEFAALGLRRPPPIPWLPRAFFLNRWIGKLTWNRAHSRRHNPLAP